MGLSASTHAVIKLVEETTGLPVDVEADSSLPSNVLAAVKMARGRTPLHSITYQPNTSTAPDYLICYQCGFILRLYSTPPDQRFDLASSDAGETEVKRLVQQKVAAGELQVHSASQYAGFLYKGFLLQLHSMPVGLHVDDWILSEYPDLMPLQRQAVMRQLDDNVAGLRPEIRQMTPERSLTLNLTMNAAFAEFWAAKLNQPQISLPFKASGHLEAGRELLEIWRTLPNNPANDRKLIDAWAQKLGVSDWYQWVPFR
jgi:hypothetical protein